MNHDTNPGDAIRAFDETVPVDDEIQRGRAELRRAEKREREQEQKRLRQERLERRKAERRKLAGIALDAAQAQDDARAARTERLRFYDEVRGAVEDELRQRIENGSLKNLQTREVVKILSVLHEQQRRDTVKGSDVTEALPMIVFGAIPHTTLGPFGELRQETLTDVYELAGDAPDTEE